MVNVAVIGSGYWGVNYVRVFSELPGSKVVAVCDASEDRLRAVRERFPLVNTTLRLDDVLENKWLDAVVVATPAATHFAIANRCLSAGKHVLVEKPMTTTVEEAERLAGLVKEAGRVLMVGHTFLYNPGILKVKQLMAEEHFGRVYYLHATRTNMGPIRQDVNALWDLAAHDVAIFNYLLEGSPKWVSAVGAGVLGNSREDVGFITLSYGEGVLANIHTSWVDPNKTREVVVVSSRRRIVFDDLNNSERVRIYKKGVAPSELKADSFGEFRLLVRDGDIISPRIETSEPLKTLAIEFLDCVAHDRQPLSDAACGLAVVRVMAAIDRSLALNGVPVEVG